VRHSAILIGSAVVVVALALLGGCTKVTVQVMPFAGVQQFPPTDPGVVGVLYTEPTRPHLRLGEINLEPHVKQSAADLEQRLQAAGAQLGADAVVVVADPSNLVGGTAATSWWGRGIETVHGEVVVGVAIRYLA
jgi:hypothetical protein